MAILKVARMGHPVLRAVAEPIEPDKIQTDEIQRLISDMVETMEEYKGAGLAGPQVHVARRVVVVELREDREAEETEVLPLINPKIRPIGNRKISDWEGCLSVPDIRGIVPRWQTVGVEALNIEGEALSFEVRGFPARLIQHEVDHLDGILYLDRMKDLRTLSFLDESARFGPDASESSDAADK